jgi:glycerol-3-phosphate dehydrogenase (NAD(P)+)
MAMRVGVIGCGQFGLVLAAHASRCGHATTLWARTPSECEPLVRTRRSPRLPGFALPGAVAITSDALVALNGADLVITAIPSQYARSVWSVLGGSLPPSSVLVSVAKGLEVGTLQLPSQVLRECVPGAEVVSLSGPSIASEVGSGLPTALVAAGKLDAARLVQRALGGNSWRVYVSEDQIGVEVAGALKNVIALAAGMIDGMQLGTNAKATLLARGIAEIARLGVELGGQRETFFGVAGVGDLATTCFSPEGRTRTLGERLGAGATLAEALASMHSIVEGVDTCRATVALAAARRVDMPLARAVHGVLFDGLAPRDALAGLMRREGSAERL